MTTKCMRSGEDSISKTYKNAQGGSKSMKIDSTHVLSGLLTAFSVNQLKLHNFKGIHFILIF